MTTAEPTADQLASAALEMLLNNATKLPDEGPVAGTPTGEIIVTLSTGPVTLPRPLFGQMKILIRAQGRAQDDLRGVEVAAAAHRARLLEAHREFQGDADEGKIVPQIDNLDALQTLRDDARSVAEENEDRVAEILTGWWVLVFETLTGKDAPPQETWPGVLVNASLPAKMIAHWRHVPVGPG